MVNPKLLRDDAPEVESALEARIRKYAEQRGWYVLKFVSPGKRFVQDRIFFRQKDESGTVVVSDPYNISGLAVTREVIVAEIKQNGKKERKGQSVRRKQMEMHGAVCRVWDNFDDAAKDLR